MLESRRHALDFRIAVLTACAAILGAAVGASVGGWVTNEGSKDLQALAERQRQARENAVARGAARALLQEFETAAVFITEANERCLYWPGLASRVRVETPLADSKLIASKLSVEDWLDVYRAQRDLELLYVVVKGFETPYKLGRPLDDDDQSYLRGIISRLKKAGAALGAIAGVPPGTP